MRLLVHALEVALAGQRDERRAVEVGVGDRRDEVQRARAERAETDARAPGEPAHHVGHVGAALLVSNRDERDRRIRERFVQIQRLFTRDAEYMTDPLRFEALDEKIRGAPLAHPSDPTPWTATPNACRSSNPMMRRIASVLVL